MKKRLLFLILFFILPIVQANDFGFDSRELIMDANIHTDLVIIPESGNFDLSTATLHLSYYPRENWQQEVMSIESQSSYFHEGDSIIFNWNNLDTSSIPITLNSKVKTKNDLIKINRKIDFPLDDVDSEYEQYLLPTENIESDDQEIIALASSLVAGQDDEYLAVFEIFNWVRDNINYSLSTSTATASQPSSWVLENRYGVCDELNSLFIALVRSVGIPARYVSGVAFTNYEEMNKWGPHGWAEIYFPGHGWVPFDVTYGQFGFVDPSHIILKQTVDSNESSIRYEWTGRNVELAANPIIFDVDIVYEEGIPDKLIQIDLSPYKTKTDFGSYNIIEAKVKNLKDYYVGTDIRLGRTEGIEIISKEEQYLALKPNQEKKIYWMIRVSDDLNENYYYDFPISAVSTRTIEGLTSFKSAIQYPYYSLNYMKEALDELREEEQLTYSKNIAVDCNLDKREWYAYESMNAVCNFRNIGNVVLKDLQACFEEDCKIFDLGIGRIETVEFPIIQENPGEYESKIIAKNIQVSKSANLQYTILDPPSVDIIDFEYPTEITFFEYQDLIFSITQISYSNPENILVVVNSKRQNMFQLSDLNEDRNFKLGFIGRNLNPGLNNLTIEVRFTDSNNREYVYQESVMISLIEVTFSQKLLIYLDNAQIWLENQIDKIYRNG